MPATDARSPARSPARRAQRADARRNIAAILDAATDCLARDPEVSIAGIAAAAGVGRITLYGHFKTRAELVDAVLARAIEHADQVLDAFDAGGDPAGALARLVAASWQIVHPFRNILLAAHRELPAERIRGVHDPILRRVQSLIARGQRAGTFRTDLPGQWLTTTVFSLMHAAAEDAAVGRTEPGDAPRLITATLQAAFTPPAGPVLDCGDTRVGAIRGRTGAEMSDPLDVRRNLDHCMLTIKDAGEAMAEDMHGAAMRLGAAAMMLASASHAVNRRAAEQAPGQASPGSGGAPAGA